MLFSKFFCPILKDTPKDATITSHVLMIKSGLIRQSSAGIYIMLPLGLRVLDKISAIVKDEMNKSGAINILMPTIQSAELWQESGRYDDYGLEMLRIKDRHDRELLYGPTNEEQVTQLFKDNVKSYKELPLNLYQVQWKFRDEIRPRFGLMRGREFLMKDAYSFDLTKEDAEISYKKMFSCYLRVFNRMNLKAVPVQADTGPIGGDLSHEFLILASTGESELFCDKNILDINSSLGKDFDYDDVNNLNDTFNKFTKYYAATDEKHNEEDTLYLQNKDNIITQRGIEVGHIFYFADKYSKAMNAQVLNKDGNNIHLLMGSYGIGVSRLMGAIIEASHDDKGIIWPKSVAPFMVIINSLGDSEDIMKQCYSIYNYLNENGIEVLFNDKADSIGVKLNTADLLGIPFQINIGKKALSNNACEFKIRKNNSITEVSLNNLEQLLELIANN